MTTLEWHSVIGGHQTRKHHDAPAADDKVVKSARKIAAPKFQDLQLAADLAVRRALNSSEITPCAMLWSCRSGPSAVRSSNSNTVQSRPTKNCFKASICRR